MTTTADRTGAPGRPSTIRHDELLACARALGPDRLSIANIAAALEVPRTTVYNHARGPEGLGRMVLSEILDDSYDGTFDTWARADPWTDQLAAFASTVRAAQLSAGPWLRFYDADVHITPDVLRLVDHLVGVLVAAGFSLDGAGLALGFVNAVVEHSVHAHGRTRRAADHADADLDLDPYPWFAAMQSGPDTSWEDTRFHYELGCAIDGIAANRS